MSASVKSRDALRQRPSWGYLPMAFWGVPPEGLSWVPPEGLSWGYPPRALHPRVWGIGLLLAEGWVALFMGMAGAIHEG